MKGEKSMNIQHLYYFKSVAELEHYGKAAEVQTTVQSNISYAITELEAELGVPLFYKLGRNVKLTKYGMIFLNYANDALRSIEAGSQEMKSLLKFDLDTCVIACPASLSTGFYLPDILHKFKQQEKNQGIIIKLRQMDTLEMLHSMKNGEISLGFGNKTDDKDIIFYPLFKEKFVLIVPKDHILANSDSINLKDLNDKEFISFDEDLDINKYINKIIKDYKLKPNIVYRVPTDTMVAEFVEKKLGIAFIPYSAGLREYKIDVIELHDVDYFRETSMLWMKGYELSIPNKRLRDFILSYYSSHSGTTD